MELINFKKGEFVRHPQFKYPAKVMEIYSDEISIFNEVDDWFHIDSEFDKLMPWTPEPDEWCWFWNEKTDVPILAKLISITELFGRKPKYEVKTPSFISETSYNYTSTISFTNCEPFIGELPSSIQNIK